MSHDEHIQNRLVNIKRIVQSIRGSSNAFNNSDMFNKGGTLGIMSFLKLKGATSYQDWYPLVSSTRI